MKSIEEGLEEEDRTVGSSPTTLTQCRAASGRKFHPDGTLPQNGEVFVFGSNLAGRHGKGSALIARKSYGARYGIGRGRMGQSFAIPTKDGRPGTPPLTSTRATLRLEDIAQSVKDFIGYASEHPEENFFVVRLGCSLAAHTDADIAPLFAAAPDNCSFPNVWMPWLAGTVVAPPVAPAINIWSGSTGLGGALTNMTERAKEKGCIQNSYPVTVNGKVYSDSEAAYQALKIRGHDAYNDGLMIDLIALKFKQHPVLYTAVTKNGGEAWLATCSHLTGAASARLQSWEGKGRESRFIRNLIYGYIKAKTGRGPATRVVHVKHAPYDEYIGRQMGSDYPQSEWHNPEKVNGLRTRVGVVTNYYERVRKDPVLMEKVKQLRGRTIGCWCKSPDEPDLLCHGDVLAALAEGREWEPPREIQGTLF